MTEAASKRQKKSRFKGFLKLLVSAGMLTLVLKTSNFEQLEQVVRSIPWWVVAGCMAGYSAGPVINCIRWYLLAKNGGINTSYPHTLRSWFIGAFVNCFGLGTIGGDLTRALLMAGRQPKKLEAMASVVADRLHGLAVLALVGSISAMIFGHKMMTDSLLLALSSLAPLIIAGWVMGPALAVKFLPRGSKIRSKLEQVALVFPRDIPTISLITAVSLVFHLLQIALHWLMAFGVGAHIPVTYLLVVVPFVNIISTLPISWNGLGVRENAYKFFFVMSAAPVLKTEQAVAMGALWLLSMTTASAIGGILSVLTPQMKQIREEQSHVDGADD